MSVTTTDERKILVPFDRHERLSLKEAADIAGKSESTMRSWCVKEGLGRRVGGGTWMVTRSRWRCSLKTIRRPWRPITPGTEAAIW
jgi:hypothetical protein